MGRKPEPNVMHARPNPCARSPFQGWQIHPVREYTDYNGGTFWETCDDEDSMAEDNPDAVGPVMFGVYLYATQGERAGEWMNVRDCGSYEDAIAFLDDITGKEVKDEV